MAKKGKDRKENIRYQNKYKKKVQKKTEDWLKGDVASKEFLE